MKSVAVPSIALENVPLFQGLPQSELNIIRNCLQERSYDKGEMLFMPGDACDRILIIHSGQIRVFRMDASGREQVLEILNPGDTCACNPGVKTWSCSSNAQAMTPCRIWSFSRDQYVQLVKHNSQFSQSLNQIFAKKLCHLSSLVEDVSLKDAKKRLVKFIIDMHDNGVAETDGKGCIYIPFSREEIARRIGTARETVARYLHELKRSRLIDIKPHRIIIRSQSEFRKLA